MTHPLLATTTTAALLALPTLLALGASAAAHAAGTVEVRWLQPERFSDVGRNAMDRERTLASLAEILKQLGTQLPDGQTLTLDVSDVDLAGEIAPGRLRDIRVLRDRADWPRMDLHFTLSAGSTLLKSGSAQLADMGYMHGPPANGGYVYEQRMIERWFKSTFANP